MAIKVMYSAVQVCRALAVKEKISSKKVNKMPLYKTSKLLHNKTNPAQNVSKQKSFLQNIFSSKTNLEDL
jgi:hypothetical protein